MKKSLRSLLSGTSAVLDIAFEMTGRRVRILQKAAAFLYDTSNQGETPKAVHSTPAEPEHLDASKPTAEEQPQEEAHTEPEAVEETRTEEAQNDAGEAAAEEAAAEDTTVEETATAEATTAEPTEPAQDPEEHTAEADTSDSAAPDAIETQEDAGETNEQHAETQANEDPFPIEGYDALNVREVEESLEGLDAAQLERVKMHEETNKNRVTALRAIQRAIDHLEENAAEA